MSELRLSEPTDDSGDVATGRGNFFRGRAGESLRPLSFTTEAQRTQRKTEKCSSGFSVLSVVSVQLTSSLCSRREDFGTPHAGGVLASSRWWSVAKATRHHRLKSAKIAGAPAGRRIRLRK
jgi:hypothetical protein